MLQDQKLIELIKQMGIDENRLKEIIHMSKKDIERELKKIYRSLCKQYHPDVGKSANEEKFKKIANIYEKIEKLLDKQTDDSKKIEESKSCNKFDMKESKRVQNKDVKEFNIHFTDLGLWNSSINIQQLWNEDIPAYIYRIQYRKNFDKEGEDYYLFGRQDMGEIANTDNTKLKDYFIDHMLSSEYIKHVIENNHSSIGKIVKKGENYIALPDDELEETLKYLIPEIKDEELQLEILKARKEYLKECNNKKPRAKVGVWDVTLQEHLETPEGELIKGYTIKREVQRPNGNTITMYWNVYGNIDFEKVNRDKNYKQYMEDLLNRGERNNFGKCGYLGKPSQKVLNLWSKLKNEPYYETVYSPSTLRFLKENQERKTYVREDGSKIDLTLKGIAEIKDTNEKTSVVDIYGYEKNGKTGVIFGHFLKAPKGCQFSKRYQEAVANRLLAKEKIENRVYVGKIKYDDSHQLKCVFEKIAKQNIPNVDKPRERANHFNQQIS